MYLVVARPLFRRLHKFSKSRVGRCLSTLAKPNTEKRSTFLRSIRRTDIGSWSRCSISETTGFGRLDPAKPAEIDRGSISREEKRTSRAVLNNNSGYSGVERAIVNWGEIASGDVSGEYVGGFCHEAPSLLSAVGTTSLSSWSMGGIYEQLRRRTVRARGRNVTPRRRNW